MRRIEYLEAETRWPESTVYLEQQCRDLVESGDVRLFERTVSATLEFAPGSAEFERGARYKSVEYALVANAPGNGKGVLPQVERTWIPNARLWVWSSFLVPHTPIRKHARQFPTVKTAPELAWRSRAPRRDIPISHTDRQQALEAAERFGNEWRSYDPDEARAAYKVIIVRGRRVNAPVGAYLMCVPDWIRR